MKKFLIFLIIVFGLFVSANVFAAEKINSFAAEININTDASINVSERIEYDFGSAQKHGIFRAIPIKYLARGGSFALRISDISVADVKGAPYQFTTSYPGNNIQIKIGDPNIEIAGRHIYIIHYTIKRAINFFNDHDELYWNITGNDWPVAIGSASAKIILPQKIAGADIQSDCFAGPFGSTEKCNSMLKGLGQIDSVSFNENQLAVNNGLTIVVGFPKGMVIKPSVLVSAVDSIRDNKGILFPIFVLVVYFGMWYRRRRYLTDCGPTIAQYDPPENLSPAEAGILWHERRWARASNIVAEIIHLAIKGYIKIIKKENGDYVLELLRDDLHDLTDCQKEIIQEIILKNGTDKKIALSRVALNLESIIYYLNNCFINNLIKNGYFSIFYRRINQIGSIISFLLIIPSFAIGMIVLGGFITGALSFFSAMIIIFIFSAFMLTTKSKEGVKAIWYIAGLKMYIEVAEERRIQFHNAPDRNPEHFEKLLPYAIALGLEKRWAQQFVDVYTQAPMWYVDDKMNHFNVNKFATSVASVRMLGANTLPESSGASSGRSGLSGGGGSGGGFGGGGGRSW
ncbi:DUF2207 domain-containing protein [Patescibacteria group bacterium]|nr:MAG: DUF2207 domain-containing protein [Patescibacteria group bacterium]